MPGLSRVVFDMEGDGLADRSLMHSLIRNAAAAKCPASQLSMPNRMI
jgi:hypothetical protein